MQGKANGSTFQVDGGHLFLDSITLYPQTLKSNLVLDMIACQTQQVLSTIKKDLLTLPFLKTEKVSEFGTYYYTVKRT